MITKGGPRVLEFNVRFGDPEAEVVLPRVRSDLAKILHAAATGRLAEVDDLDVDPRPCVGVVMASAGYPGAYQAGKEIEGLDGTAEAEGVQVFHSGTRLRDGRLVTAGGRVLCVSALGPDLATARARAYDRVGGIRFDGAAYRTDIAHRALAR
jgi:phosphoribosylamine--glycine ligase